MSEDEDWAKKPMTRGDLLWVLNDALEKFTKMNKGFDESIKNKTARFIAAIPRLFTERLIKSLKELK